MFYYKILWQINSKMTLNYPCLYLVSRLSVAILAYTLWLKKQPCWGGPGSEVLGWSSDSSQQETEDRSLTWHKETNPANHHMSLKVNCFPVELSDETSMWLTPRLPPCERPWSTGPRQMMPNVWHMKLGDNPCILFYGAEDVSHLLHTNVLLIPLFIFLFHWSISFFRWDTLSYSFLCHQKLTLCMAHSSSLINIVLNSVVVKQVNWFCRKELSFLTPTIWLSFHSSSESQIFLYEKLEGLDLL